MYKRQANKTNIFTLYYQFGLYHEFGN